MWHLDIPSLIAGMCSGAFLWMLFILVENQINARRPAKRDDTPIKRDYWS